MPEYKKSFSAASQFEYRESLRYPFSSVSQVSALEREQELIIGLTKIDIKVIKEILCHQLRRTKLIGMVYTSGRREAMNGHKPGADLAHNGTALFSRAYTLSFQHRQSLRLPADTAVGLTS